MGKYIIELQENTHWIQWIMEGTKDHHPYMDYKQVEDLTPYTEPDLDAVRKEAYEQGHKDGYNKHDTERIRKRGYDKGLDDIGNALRLLLFQYSNYTLQEIFGYDTARAVVEHFEGSEIVARIRCYEGGVKQDVETIRKEAYDKGYETAKHECEDCKKNRADAEQELVKKAYDTAYADAEEIYENGKRAMYQKGLNDAWKAARKVVALSTVDRRKVFGSEYMYSILEKHTASEAIEKLKAYEQEKEEIKVGDEVEAMAGNAVVIEVIDGGKTVRYMYPDTITGRNKVCNVTRTGRHFPEIAAVLEKMRGE